LTAFNFCLYFLLQSYLSIPFTDPSLIHPSSLPPLPIPPSYLSLVFVFFPNPPSLPSFVSIFILRYNSFINLSFLPTFFAFCFFLFLLCYFFFRIWFLLNSTNFVNLSFQLYSHTSCNFILIVSHSSQFCSSFILLRSSNLNTLFLLSSSLILLPNYPIEAISFSEKFANLFEYNQSPVSTTPAINEKNFEAENFPYFVLKLFG
jgi:hypothetical protein